MAQMGSFVPAREAKIGLVDRIFTRVGAQRPDPARPVHVHGRDAGDRPHPAPRHAAQPRAARRDRPRHRHLRRPLDRVGGGRAPRARRARPEDHLRDPLPRARRPRRRPAAASATSTSRPASGRTPSCSSARSRPAAPTARSASTWRAWPGCRPASWCAPRRSCATSRARSSTARAGPASRTPTTAAPAGARQLTLFSGQDDAVLDELRRADPDRLTPLEALALLAELRKRLSR